MGSVIANLLELKIADRTNGEKGLDDVMRFIWQRTRDEGAAFDAAAIRTATEEVAGGSFEDFFDSYVFGTDNIPFAEFFTLAGYDLLVDEDATATRNRRGFLGVVTRESNGGLRIVQVVRGSSAWSGGLNYGDVIVSVGGVPVTGSQSLTAALAPLGPGQEVQFVVSRLGQNETFAVTLGERPAPVYKMIETQNPTARQLAVRRRWRMEK